MSDPLIGRVLGDYTIEELLGKGGMARVYRGYDDKLKRFAAVKVINTELENDELREEYQARFVREARAIARLQHPNIVGVYQFDQLWDLNFMAMQFIEGDDLRYLLEDYHNRADLMPLKMVVAIMRDIASALDYAHAHGVIHRDIKPSNIMVTPEGRAVLTDFGLVLNLEDGTIGNTFGSAHYIAPEQAISSAQAVAQSDLYSLGVVLFEMVTGKVPFDDPSTMAVALKHLNDPPPAPSTINPAISPALEDVILHLLRKDPADRYPDGATFIAALSAAVSEKALQADDEEDTVELTSTRAEPKRAAEKGGKAKAAPAKAGAEKPGQAQKDAPKAAPPQPPAPRREIKTRILPDSQSTDTPQPIRPAKQQGRGRLIAGLLALLIVAIVAIVLFSQGGGFGGAPAASPTPAAGVAAETAVPTDESEAAGSPRPTRTESAPRRPPGNRPRPAARPRRGKSSSSTMPIRSRSSTRPPTTSTFSRWCCARPTRIRARSSSSTSPICAADSSRPTRCAPATASTSGAWI
jgi:serine/threonine protein kinase